jgi:hypothetical protein
MIAFKLNIFLDSNQKPIIFIVTALSSFELKMYSTEILVVRLELTTSKGIDFKSIVFTNFTKRVENNDFLMVNNEIRTHNLQNHKLLLYLLSYIYLKE